MPYTDEDRALTQTHMLLDVATETSSVQSSAPWMSAVVQLTNMGARAVLPLHDEARRQQALRQTRDEHGSGSYDASRFTATLRALGIINDPRSLPLLHEILPHALASNDRRDPYAFRVGSVYNEILQALARYGDPTSVDHIQKLLARFTREKTTRYVGSERSESHEHFKGQDEATLALHVLSRIGTREALDVFLANIWLVDKPTEVIVNALEGFGGKLEERLHTFCGETDAYRKTASFEALRHGKNAKTIDLAIAALAKESGATLAAAFGVLEARKDNRATDAIESFLDEALVAGALPTPEGYRVVNAEWRGQAILGDALKLYAGLAGAASVPLLLRFAARDKPVDQRNKVAAALIVGFDRDALPALQARVTNEDPDIAHAAATLLARITSGAKKTGR